MKEYVTEALIEKLAGMGKELGWRSVFGKLTAKGKKGGEGKSMPPLLVRRFSTRSIPTPGNDPRHQRGLGAFRLKTRIRGADKVRAAGLRHHLPAIVIGEYECGLAGSKRNKELNAWFALLVSESIVLAVDRETAAHYGAICVTQAQRHADSLKRPVDRRAGGAIRAADCQPDRHFDRVPGLRRLFFGSNYSRNPPPSHEKRKAHPAANRRLSPRRLHYRSVDFLTGREIGLLSRAAHEDRVLDQHLFSDDGTGAKVRLSL